VRLFPTAILRRDGWDDYDFKTSFWVTIMLSKARTLDLETVKIATRGQERGRTRMPEEIFDGLDADYYSLGQASSYYEQLLSAGEKIYAPYLRGMRDLVFLSELRAGAEQEQAAQRSLLRFDSAVRALRDAPALFTEGSVPIQRAPLSFTYEMPIPGNPATTFSFSQNPKLPGRMSVVIGYNGVGKTRFLADLAMLAYADDREARGARFAKRFGRYVGDPPRFGGIVAISYSAFDDFAIPGEGSDQNAKREREQSKRGTSPRRYRYCGLRRLTPDGRTSQALKTIKELTAEFHTARAHIQAKERWDILEAAMQPIIREPSIRNAGDLPAADDSEQEWVTGFARLSTGHKIVLSMVVQLCAYLERRSLVLIDEPELHLHPPLLAALIRSIGVSLDHMDSFAIAATHSPVVLQEIPARNVIVLRRFVDDVALATPELETFGESVGLLTKHVFNLDSRDTDYQGTLEDLAQEHSVEEIASMFTLPLSTQARSLILSAQRANAVT
jgi:predicted ATPase